MRRERLREAAAPAELGQIDRGTVIDPGPLSPDRGASTTCSTRQRAAQHLGDAPRLRDAAARRERRLGVEDLADRADARFVEVRARSRRAAARAPSRRPDAPSARRRRTGRSARPRRCPGDRPRRARAGRRSTSPCSRRWPGASERRPTGVSSRSRDDLHDRLPSALRSSTGWSSEIANTWFGRQRGIVAVLAVDDVVEVAAGRRTRSAG